jgi:hypothetical protein
MLFGAAFLLIAAPNGNKIVVRRLLLGKAAASHISSAGWGGGF